MKKRISIVMSFAIALLIALAYICTNISAYAAEVEENPSCGAAVIQEDFAEDSVIVVLKTEFSAPACKPDESSFKVNNVESARYLTSLARNAEQTALTNTENFRHIVSVVLKNPGKKNVLKAAEDLRKLHFVESAEPNYYGSFASVSGEAKPDEQLALEKINAYRALDLIDQDAERVRVGVIDSGIADHPYLRNNLEAGWDFYNDNNITSDDTYGHGTHVAGIILSANPNVSLVPLQVLMSKLSGNGFTSDAIVSAIEYARLNNIPIINLSFQMNHLADIETEISNYKGLIVCAANNFKLDLDDALKYKSNRNEGIKRYPAAYSLEYDNILTVGATTIDPITSEESRAEYSNYGKKAVQLFAPGTDILSTYPEKKCDENKCDPVSHVERGYHYMSGTSMAAPFVSGAAALLMSQFPHMTIAEVKKAIIDNVDVLPELDYDPMLRQPLCTSGGRLNIYNALLYSSDAEKPDFRTMILPDGTIEIGRFNISYERNLVVPSQIDGKAVTSIAPRAFSNRNFTTVSIPDTVTRIGRDAFGNTSWYNSLLNGPVYAGKVLYKYKGTMPTGTVINDIRQDTVSIADFAFYYCAGLTSIIIPSGVKAIGKFAFEYCAGLTDIILVTGLTYIGASAFCNTGLINISIPNSVTKIDISAFEDCTEIASVTFASNSQLTDIGIKAFYNCVSMVNIDIPSSVERIGNYAFSSEKRTGSYAYLKNSELANVTFESGSRLTDIGVNLFMDCKELIDITIPASVKSIGDYAFLNCEKLANVTFESGSQLANIGYSAFSFCSSLANITIPDSVTKIEQSAFQQTAMWNNAPDNSIVYADKWVVGYKGTISGSVFLRDDTVGICDYAFWKCTGLTKLTIPASVENIGYDVFYGCSNLTVFWFSNPAVSQDVFKGTKLITIPQSNEAYIGQYDYYTERAVWCPAGGAAEININFEAGNGLIQLCGSPDIYADIYDLEGNYIGSIAGGGWIGLDGTSYKIIINNYGADGEIVKLILLSSSYYVEYAGEYEDEVEFFFDGNNRAAVYTMLFYASADGTYLLTLDGADIHFGYGAIAYLTTTGYYGDTLETESVGVYKIEMTTGWYFITFYSFGGSWSIGLIQ